MNLPFIVRFENQTGASAFDVVVNHESYCAAQEWTREYFSLLTVTYRYSDFNNEHTFHCEGK